ncbi:MAG: pyridoxal phosphate-dependent aminotransferase [Phycisphaerae bacterium]|jgi:aspartate aminotransferase
MAANDSGPEYVVKDDALLPVTDYISNMAPIPPSRMFLIKQSLKAYTESVPGGTTFDASQGDGGASLGGVPAEVLEEAHRLQLEHGTAYDMPYGCDAFRKSVIEDYWRVDEPTGLTPANVVACQGGRDALVKAYTAMLTLGEGRIGDVLVTTRVPWISYNWGPYGVGANVMLAPGDASTGWAYSPQTIQACVDRAARDGRKIACLVITSPDNPTGNTLSADKQVALGKAALRAGARYVLYDWMYHWVTDESPMDLSVFLQHFDSAERSRVLILDGITKSLGASNIRNAHLIADELIVKFIQSRASHAVIPSFHSQAVAIAAFRAGFRRAAAPIIEPTNASREVLREFVDANSMTAITGKGYYAFIDVSKWLRAADMQDSAELGEYLAKQHGVAVVPGVFFSVHGADWIRFSYALPPETTLGALRRFMEGLNALSR